MASSRRTIVILKTVVWVLCLTPLGLLAWRAFNGRLGANPIEFVTHRTGFWALTFLVTSLAITPFRKLSHWNDAIKFRRLVGLFAFFYALLHFATYMVLDQFFDFSAIGADILKRPYITVGFVAFLILLALAATSTKGSIRRLGKRWNTLHQLIYAAGVLAVLHFYWKRSAKHDIFEPLVFASILAVLLALRIPMFIQRARARRQKRTPRNHDVSAART